MKKKKSAPNCLKRMINTKKHMLLFSLNVKMIPAYFFHSFQGFSKRISCDPNPDSWSLKRRNEVVCIAHFLKLWFNHSFPFPFGLDAHFFFADPDLFWANCELRGMYGKIDKVVSSLLNGLKNNLHPKKHREFYWLISNKYIVL